MSQHSFYEESVEDDSARLFTGYRFDLIRRGNLIIFESRLFNSPAAKFFAAISFLLSLLAIATLMDRLDRGIPLTFKHVIHVMLPIIFGVLSLLYSFYPRRFIFDFESKSCTFSHIPGLSYRLSIQDIDAIDVLKLKWSRKIILGLAFRGKRRRLRIHEFPQKKVEIAEIEEQLPRITSFLSKLLDKPSREIENATSGMSTWA